MSKAFDKVFSLCAAAAALVLINAAQACAQSSQTSAHTPPPGQRTLAPSGPVQSPMPLVDPKTVPPGSGIPNAAPTGTPGVATDGMHGGRTAPPGSSR